MTGVQTCALPIWKAGSEDYVTSMNKAGTFSTLKKKSKVEGGRKTRSQAGRFELKVRRDLENNGKIVDKWNNNVDLSPRDDSGEPDEGAPLGVPQSTERRGKLIIAKRKYNPFSKAMTIGTGFPDFISIKRIYEGAYSVIGVEVKINGVLSRIEKEKCAWYLQKKIFSAIWIAKKGKKRGEIAYDDFQEKYGKKYNKV